MECKMPTGLCWVRIREASVLQGHKALLGQVDLLEIRDRQDQLGRRVIQDCLERMGCRVRREHLGQLDLQVRQDRKVRLVLADQLEEWDRLDKMVRLDQLVRKVCLVRLDLKGCKVGKARLGNRDQQVILD